MIVVTTVAALTTAVLSTCSGYVREARMVEGIAGVGTIRKALRVYAVTHGGRYPVLLGVSGADLNILGFYPGDLDGKYFKAASYVVASTENGYVVSATYAGMTYALDQDGNEVGAYRTEAE